MLFDIGKTFMYNGVEYRINHINEEQGRLGLEQIGERVVHKTGQKIKIEDNMFTVVYVHTGKNRISIKPIREK